MLTSIMYKLLGPLLVLLGPFALIYLFEPTIHYFQHHHYRSSTHTDDDVADYQLHYYGFKKGSDYQTYLSLVIPAYNEEDRLVGSLDETVAYMNMWSLVHGLNYELIIVDDGSKDRTAEIVHEYMKKQKETMTLLQLHLNSGKGAALKVGVQEARGSYVLILDADGATRIADVENLLDALRAVEVQHHDQQGTNETFGMVVGSRAHLVNESISTRAYYRTVLMRGFHMYVQLLVTRSVRDTQCGFKLFTRATAKLLFSHLHLFRWAFDTEIIYLAERLHIPLKEVPVTWHEVAGSKLITSKLDVVTTSITMARDILCMRLSYLLTIWTYPDVEPIRR